MGSEPAHAETKTSRPPPTSFTYTDGPDRDHDNGEFVEGSYAPGQPATKAAAKLLDIANEIAATGTDIEYTHGTKVRRKEGLYHFDCSGMLNWMLPKVSKKALAALDRERPVAATYVKTIAKAPKSRARDGWQNIVDIEQVEPGDLFAWKRPADWPSGGATGHVGIVIARPVPAAEIEGAYLVRVIDSTRYRHQDDTRKGDETGFGMGTILFMTDADRRPIGYGWYGSQSGGWYETQVVFGRVY